MDNKEFIRLKKELEEQYIASARFKVGDNVMVYTTWFGIANTNRAFVRSVHVKDDGIHYKFFTEQGKKMFEFSKGRITGIRLIYSASFKHRHDALVGNEHEVEEK